MEKTCILEMRIPRELTSASPAPSGDGARSSGVVSIRRLGHGDRLEVGVEADGVVTEDGDVVRVSGRTILGIVRVLEKFEKLRFRLKIV